MEIQRKALCENVVVIYDLRVLQLHNKYIFDRRRKTEARPVESGGFQSAQWMARGIEVKPF